MEFRNEFPQLAAEMRRIAASVNVERTLPKDVMEMIGRIPRSGPENLSICRWLIPLLVKPLVLPPSQPGVALQLIHNWNDWQLTRIIAWLEHLLQQLLDLNAARNQEVSDFHCNGATEVLICVMTLVKSNPRIAPSCWEIFESDRSGYRLLVANKTDDELLSITLQCLDSIATNLYGMTINTSLLNEYHLNKVALTICIEVGKVVLQFHYDIERPPFWNSTNRSAAAIYVIRSLSLLNKLCLLNVDFVEMHISEIFGLARTYLSCGILNVPTSIVTVPQRVHPSQQALHFNPDIVNTKVDGIGIATNGKVMKTRKPRIARNKNRPIDVHGNDNENDYENEYIESANNYLVLDLRNSDSEISEAEGAPNGLDIDMSAQERRQCSKLRLMSIHLLGVASTVVPRRVINAYLHVFFPFTSDEPITGNNFTTTITSLLNMAIRDPAVRCRCAVLQIAAQIIYNTRHLLSNAEHTCDDITVAAFLPFSQNLASMIVAIYDRLSYLLANESSLLVLTQSLKCLAALVQATPFQKMRIDFLNRCIPHVRSLVEHRDYIVQVSALIVMQFLVSTTHPTPEIDKLTGLYRRQVNNRTQNDDEFIFIDDEIIEDEIEIIDVDENEMAKDPPKEEEKAQGHVALDSKKEDEEQEQAEEEDEQPNIPDPWLINRVLFNLESTSTPTFAFLRPLPATIRIESLQMLSAIMTAGHAAQLIHNDYDHDNVNLQKLSIILRTALLDPSFDVRLYAARLMDRCAYEFNRLLPPLPIENESDILLLNNLVNFWQQMLPILMDHIVSPLEQAASLKVCLCDSISNIGEGTYEELPRSLQLQIISFLSGISKSNEPNIDDDNVMFVRAAAARAMAMFVVFPSLCYDLVYVENTAETILLLLNDPNVHVRVKAMWALGNVSDALLETRLHNCNDGGDADQGEKVSEHLLQSLIRAAVNACHDSDKVRCNAVRALGNLLRLLSDTEILIQNYQLFETAINRLGDCVRLPTGNAKVKWNAAYAIGNLLHNDALFEHIIIIGTGNGDWRLQLFTSLCHVIGNNTNFKVRINAANAILSIKYRQHFGTHFSMFWATLLTALNQSSQFDNYNEYNHRDKLQQQLCLTICHLLDVAELEDLPQMRGPIMVHFDIVKNLWMRVIHRMVPEQSASLCSAANRLRNRLAGNELTADQVAAIDLINRTFDSI